LNFVTACVPPLGYRCRYGQYLARALAIESGYRVRQARKARGCTLEELAQKTGLTGSEIGDFGNAQGRTG